MDILARVAQLRDAEIEAWQTEHADEIDALVAELLAAKEDRLPSRSGPSSSAAQHDESVSVVLSAPAVNENRLETGAEALVDRAR